MYIFNSLMEGVKIKIIWVFLKIDLLSYMNKIWWKSFLRIYIRCVVGMLVVGY